MTSWLWGTWEGEAGEVLGLGEAEGYLETWKFIPSTPSPCGGKSGSSPSDFLSLLALANVGVTKSDLLGLLEVLQGWQGLGSDWWGSWVQVRCYCLLMVSWSLLSHGSQ